MANTICSIDEKDIMVLGLRRYSLSIRITPTRDYKYKNFKGVHVNPSCLEGIDLKNPKLSKPKKSCVIEFFPSPMDLSDEETADKHEALEIIKRFYALNLLKSGQYDNARKAIEEFF